MYRDSLNMGLDEGQEFRGRSEGGGAGIFEAKVGCPSFRIIKICCNLPEKLIFSIVLSKNLCFHP